MQLGLDLPYPSLSPIQLMLEFIGVHRWPPSIPASSLPTCWPSSPSTKLSSARTTTGPPPHPRPSADDGPAPGRAGYPAGRATVDGSRVHDVPINKGDAQLCPGSIATATPQTFTMASPPAKLPGFGVDRPPIPAITHCTPAHIHQVGAGSSLTERRHWFLSYTFPSRLPDPHRLAVPARPVVVRAASRPPRRLPDQTALSFTQLLRQPGGGVLSPPLGHIASRGAQFRRRTTDHRGHACRIVLRRSAAE